MRLFLCLTPCNCQVQQLPHKMGRLKPVEGCRTQNACTKVAKRLGITGKTTSFLS